MISSAPTDISQNVIYDHPTLSNLAKYLSSFVHSFEQQPDLRMADQISAMVSKYSLQLGSQEEQENTVREKETILLTGSTGSLGSNILARLLEDFRVQKVWALVRGEVKEAIERQRTAFSKQGLDSSLLDSGKVTFLAGNLTLGNLGLEGEIFEEVYLHSLHVIFVLKSLRAAEGLHNNSDPQCMAAGLQLVFIFV